MKTKKRTKKKGGDVDPKQEEMALAGLLDQVNRFLGDGDDDLPSAVELTNRLAHLESMLPEGMKAGELAGVMQEFDELKATQRGMQTKIRTSRSGAYIPGLEDQATSFSLVRALNGMFNAKKGGDWTDQDAGFEKEVIDQVRAKAAQSVGEDTLGGYFVPDQVIPQVIEAIYTNTVFISLDGEGGTLASVLAGLTGGEVTVPKFEGGTQAYWIGEQDPFTESNATFGDITMNPKKLGVLVKLTDSMQKFGGFGFEALLRRDIVKAASTMLDNTVLYGKGGGKSPRGIAFNEDIWVYSQEAGTSAKNNLTALTTLNGGDWGGGSSFFHYDDLMTMDLLLEEDDIQADASYHTVLSPRAILNLKQFKIDNFSGQTDDQAYLLGAPMANDAQVAGLIGAFSKMNQVGNVAKPGASVAAPTTSSTAKFTDVLRGNLSEIVIGRWGGIEIEDDRGLSNFTTDHTLLKLRLYVDVNVRQGRKLMLCPDARATA